MKKLLKLLLFVGAVAGAAWALRDQLMPPPQTPTGSPPAFRTHDSEPRAAHTEPTATDDLTDVTGIGPVRIGLLAEQGITTFAQLADADAVDLAAKLGVAVSQTEDWIGQAGDLA
jgi:predicted flap endonuclease-1-like 5' DNA nuclease